MDKSANVNEKDVDAVELSRFDLLANAVYYAFGINPKKRREEIALFFSKVEEHLKKRLLKEGAEL